MAVSTLASASATLHRSHHHVVVIGGGPAGLATSYHLTESGVDHVVLERGRIAERWRSERWDSLRLLTPNWQTRLPGWGYGGCDPDGYMTAHEVTAHLDAYARSFGAPVIEGVNVDSVRPAGEAFEVKTDVGVLHSNAVVIATGSVPSIPAWAGALPPSITQVHSSRYRNPEHLPPGGVLVVGASASGMQLAAELAAAGRDVVLSVGSHTRLPRTYRGRDVHWWLDVSGTLEKPIAQVADLERARRSPSLQLVGTPDRRTLDLGTIGVAGVEMVGRTLGVEGWTVRFANDLGATTAAADRRLVRLLDRFDQVATAAALDGELDPPVRPEPIRLTAAVDRIDLDRRGISTVLWSTGFRPHYPWLHVPVTDATGAIVHDGGICDWPGLYTMGLPFMRRRNSTFLDGFGEDAHAIVAHLLSRGGGSRND